MVVISNNKYKSDDNKKNYTLTQPCEGPGPKMHQYDYLTVLHTLWLYTLYLKITIVIENPKCTKRKKLDSLPSKFR